MLDFRSFFALIFKLVNGRERTLIVNFEFFILFLIANFKFRAMEPNLGPAVAQYRYNIIDLFVSQENFAKIQRIRVSDFYFHV